MITDFELGWLCGLLEGEGWFEYRNKTQRVGIQMTDEDTIIRYAALIQRITGNKPNIIPIQRQRVKDIYQVCVCGVNARAIMNLIIDRMGKRRRARIWQSLNKFTPKKIPIEEIMASLTIEATQQ